MRAPRFASAAALVAVIALLSAPVTAATATEQPDARSTARPVAPVGDEPARMIEVDVLDFIEAGDELPIELQQALSRDVGLSGAEWLAQSEAANAAADVVADLHEVIEVVDARLEGYDLVVTVESETDARIAESVGARVEFGSAADQREPEYIEGLEPAADLRGGMPYSLVSGRCSIGFVGFNSQSAQLQMMSAGHCLGSSGNYRSALEIDRPTLSGGTTSALTQIGLPGPHYTDEQPNPDYPEPVNRTYYDHGMTPVTNGTWVGKPEVVTWGNSTTGAPLALPPLIVRDAGPAIVGGTLCKSGSTSGWTCGTINGVDLVLKVGGTPGNNDCTDPTRSYCVGAIQASICVRQGDSGGAALVGSRAVGIVSAASNATLIYTCTPGANPNIGVFSTLYSANPAWEQITKLFPNWEPLIGLSNPTIATAGINRYTTTMAGSLANGTVRHGITLQTSTAGTLSTSVSSNGAWSVNLNSLPSGTTSYTLRSRWGSGAQTSGPVNGTFVRADAQRLAGADRFQTAIEISRYTFGCGATYPSASACNSGQVPVVYIANGSDFPDALSAGPAAALEGGPLLLTDGTSLSGPVAAELTRLKPATIVVVGGLGVVSSSVQTALRAYTTTQTAGSVPRLGGSSRYETSRLIAQRLRANNLLAPGSGLWVATGNDYPDALSAGAAAAGAGVPILLVDGSAGGLDAATSSFISTTLASSKVSIAGGPGVVSSGIQSALNGLVGSSNVTRAGGSNRLATSLLINQLAYPASGPDSPEVYLTFAENFPDALAGGVLAGTVGGPLYITQPGCVIPGMVDHIFTASPGKVVVFGGPAVVSDNARDLRRC